MNPVEVREVKCSGCGGEFSLGEEYWDKNVVCPVCDTAFYVRPPPYQPGAQPLRPGQILLDDFLVESVLGEGGMGRVYLLSSRSTGSRFAVKHLKGLSASDRRNFRSELQQWVDLPEHANLLSCRFVRNLGDELLIFGEPVESGSLKQWIEVGNLYAGDPRTALARLLDVALQFAWGLHCLHELQLVHQAVKPANVMMTPDGTARITDFELATLRARAHPSATADPKQSAQAGSSASAAPYDSPEQAAGQPMSRATDIWSWGVSVLEMFTGKPTWNSGPAAAEALEAYLRERGADAPIPAMPVGLVVVLMGCFQPEFTLRWKSMATVVEKLRVVYAKATQSEYRRELTGANRQAETQTGVKNRDPAAGTCASAPTPGTGPTRQTDGALELAACGETKRLYARLLRAGRNELRSDLATVCLEKAQTSD